MNVNKFIRFYEVKRNDLTLAEAIEYLEVTPAQFNRLRKLDLFRQSKEVKEVLRNFIFCTMT